MSIVYTNGAFDMLHPGHLYLLERAGALGDIVIVGLDSDARYETRREKRPYYTYAERKNMLEFGGIEVLKVNFEDDIYEQLAQADVYVKGSDAEGNEVQQRIVEAAHALGIETYFIPVFRKERYSSSAIKGSLP